ncbi:SLATT domain-containing protein [Streptomyces buecherae]
MSQPEMRPEGLPRGEGGTSGTGAAGGGGESGGGCGGPGAPGGPGGPMGPGGPDDGSGAGDHWPSGDGGRGPHAGRPGGRAARAGDEPYGGRRAARRRPADLLGRPIPLGDWGEPTERLDELYRWAEEGALRVADWYLADRAWKRRAARSLRAGAALAATVGAVLPLLELTHTLSAGAAWGCLALVAAVACLACDRFFGLTSGWMRDMATAQAVHRRLEALQFDWSVENVREVLGPTDGTASEAAERCLGVLRRFVEDVTELVRAETADWMIEFGSRSAPLSTQSLAWHARPESGTPLSRLLLPPGTRPNMPRQRPPESPR